MIFVRNVNGKIIPDKEAQIFKNTVPKNIKQVYDNKVFPVGKTGLMIPENAIGFIIIGRQLIFDNSNSVVEYYTGMNREDFFDIYNPEKIIPPKYFKVGVFLNGEINENENNMNKYLFNSIHISKKGKIVSITLNESLIKIKSISEDYTNCVAKSQMEKRRQAISKVKEELNDL